MERSSSPTDSHVVIKKVRLVRAAIWLLLLLVFLGIVFIWIMMPTNTYSQTWLPEIRAKTDSTTYFGRQGDKFLLFTFPVLFIASLGCVYIHLGKKYGASESRNHHRPLASWSRPVLVKGPLGIVSWTELAFLFMFIALLVWSFSMYLHLGFERISPQSASKEGEQVWETKLNIAALRLGLVGNICLAFLFFPVTRGSSVLPLVGLTSEASIKYHIWLGHTVMTLFTAHGLCYIIYWAATHQISEILKWDKVGISNMAGELSLLSGLVLWATTYPRIRRKMFELFFYTHHLYILFIIFFILHVGIVFASMMLPGFYLFMFDRYLRFLQSRKSVRLISARVLPCETIELNFSKSPGLSYTPTSIVFINVPSISKLQWHPFTVSSSSNMDQDQLSVVVKSEGSWTKKLYQMLSSPSPMSRLDVSIEGPYGPPSNSFMRHDKLVMISGGSGITPFISIIRELIFKTKLGFKSPSILLVCAFKNSSSLTMLDLLLPISGSGTLSVDISSLHHLQIEAYITREEEPKSELNQDQLRLLCFKPNLTDMPISPILGPNSWLWLGAIISYSFIIFLLFLGLLTRYYIYPIDHNTNNIYSTSSRALLNMLFLCVCIAMTASVAFLWNIKQRALEGKQIQNVDAPMTPTTTSPYSLSYADRELESLPHESFVHATKVHYGKRPDLEKILLECEESSVGVIVSGPRKLRKEAATICASGLANNLHLESISFTW